MLCILDYSIVFCNAHGKKNHILCRKTKVGIHDSIHVLNWYKDTYFGIIVHCGIAATEVAILLFCSLP